MKTYAINTLKITLFIFALSIINACSSQKDTAGSRAMQNLTSRYNYIYNAKTILANHQQELTETYADNYDEVLPVYISPEKYDMYNLQSGANMPEMEEIIKKAKVIILEKGYGNYVDDAYLLLGKANYYKGNYFNSLEYFDYTAKTFPNITNSRIQALDWKARSLMQLSKYSEATKVTDTLSDAIFSLKRNKAEPLATIAQLYIYQRRNNEAIAGLKAAIQAGPSTQDRIRWTYILAQLYESQQNFAEALQYYHKVEKSNAPFEMYFNANLNRIKLYAFIHGTKINREEELLSMLKDDKNDEYHDQIYYQVAEAYLKDEEYDLAKKYYNLSVRNSTKNTYQKGLSYLKIADLNFKHYRNYLNARSYYDSAVLTLPKTYPGYDLIVKKNQNLQYLTDRYELISWEDTLQHIAKLPEADRKIKILALANPVVTTTTQHQDYNVANPAQQQFLPATDPLTGKKVAVSTFYFANKDGVAKGFNDFKRKWGNRKLENNWRQSVKSSAQETFQDINNNYATNQPGKTDSTLAAVVDTTSKAKQIEKALPTTPELLAKSDQKIIDAYFDIANFYLQELNDYKEAADVYDILLKRYPNNSRLAAIYYGMFLVNKTINPARSEEFKNKILKEFATTTYAKSILDPSFSMKQSEIETAVSKAYNSVFDQYEQKDFKNVILRADEINTASPDNYLAPQFAYLKAISIGRTNNVDSLITAFTAITTRFQDDRLITPLVKDHLAYIEQHLADFKKRKIALTDFDPNEPRFFTQQFPGPETIKNPVAQVPVTPAQKPVTPVTAPPPAVKPTETKPAEVKPVVPEKPAAPVKVASIFSTAPSNTYYFVIDVADATLTLSSSRFGIGQFNRGNYAEENLRHQLKEFDNDQLIFVGNFGTFDDAKTYAAGITPQLKQIMKVPANLYTSFIISKENFDKLSSKELLDKYLEFYKNNY